MSRLANHQLLRVLVLAIGLALAMLGTGSVALAGDVCPGPPFGC